MRRGATDTFRQVRPPRVPTAWERLALTVATSAADDAARSQLAGLRIRAECTHCPTVDFEADRAVQPVQSGERLLHGDVGTLHGTDGDGMFVEIVVIAEDGYITAMDVWRGDGAAFGPPDLAAFRQL